MWEKLHDFLHFSYKKKSNKPRTLRDVIDWDYYVECRKDKSMIYKFVQLREEY